MLLEEDNGRPTASVRRLVADSRFILICIFERFGPGRRKAHLPERLRTLVRAIYTPVMVAMPFPTTDE